MVTTSLGVHASSLALQPLSPSPLQPPSRPLQPPSRPLQLPSPPPWPPQVPPWPLHAVAVVARLNERYVACAPGVFIRGFDKMTKPNQLPWLSYWPPQYGGTATGNLADRMSGTVTNVRLPYIFMGVGCCPEFNDSPPGQSVTVGEQTASVGVGGVVFSSSSVHDAMLCSFDRDSATLNDRNSQGCAGWLGDRYSPSALLEMLQSHEHRAKNCMRRHNINNCYNEVCP